MTNRTPAPFLTTMLFATLLPLFAVISTAFVSIPYALGGHPGEARAPGAATTIYHPS